uniref:Uncharacterized protein n=1 Tax=Anguilla anguilla TaxID=7936 RepID=A0A0E9U572_ANGAN
MSTVRQILILG